MANLKAGTLIGGNMIWNHGNMPLSLANNELYLKTYKIYTEASKPTPAEVGAVNKAGDTMTGNLNMSGASRINFTSINTGVYIQSGKGDGASQDVTNLQIRTWQGLGISPTAGNDALVPDAKNSIWMNARNGTIQSIGEYYAQTNKRVYHEGFKPTYTDVGGAPDGFGLGATQCPRVPNKNLDEAINAGFYAIYGEDAGGPLNSGLGPSGSRLLVVSWSSQHVTQMFWPINSTDVYVRYKGTNAGDTNWSDWQRIYTTRNKPTADDVGALPISGGTMTGALVINNQVIKGQFDRTLLRDHGNGNVTLSASSNSSGNAGDLYLGYNSGSTNMTKTVRIESPMSWKGGTVIVNDGGLNSEFLQGPIRTEKDSAGVWHTVVGGTDTVNRGRTIIAAGEAGKHVADNTTTADERIHIAGDAGDGVWIHTGVQNGWDGSTHKKVKFQNGDIYAEDGTKQVFRQGWDFGLGGRQGACAVANEYTEGKTYDFNDLITAGEFGVSGNWANGINNVPEASGHTGTVKVEVRHWSAGPAYVQTFTYSGAEHVARAVRYGTGTYPNITWKKWIRFGPYEVQAEYRMTINRSGETVYPYMSIVKADKRTDLTSGYYVAGALQFKESPTDMHNPDTGRPMFIVRSDTTWNQELNRGILQLRKAIDNTTASEIVMYEDNVRLIVNGKASEFKEASANLPGTLQIVGKLNNGAFATSNKQILNANSSDYVYVGNPTVKRLYLETDANGEVYVNANGSAKRVYHEGKKPTAADVGAVANSGNQLVNAQVAFRTLNSADTTSLRDLDYAGFYRTNGYEVDGIKLPNLMIHCPHSSGKAHGRGIGFNYAGWGLWTTSWNSSGVFQGMKKIYTEVDKPTAAELGVMPATGNTNFNWSGTQSNLPGHLFHNLYSSSDKTVYIHASPSGETESYNSKFQFRARKGTTYSVTDIHSDGVTSNGYFNSTSAGAVVHTIGGFIRADTADVMSMDGKKYSFVTSPLDAHLCMNSYWNGSAWKKYNNSAISAYVVAHQNGQIQIKGSSAGSTDPNQRTTFIHSAENGNTTITGTLNVGGSMYAGGDVSGGYLACVNAAYPKIELHAPGVNAGMMWLDHVNSSLNLGHSNGSGGEHRRMAHWYLADSSMNQYGAIRIPSASTSWGAHSAAGGITPLHEEVRLTTGEWHPLIVSPTYIHNTQGYSSRWSIGHYRANDNRNGDFVINMTGDGYLRNNQRFHFNDLGMLSAAGTHDGGYWTAHSGGFDCSRIGGNIIDWTVGNFSQTGWQAVGSYAMLGRFDWGGATGPGANIPGHVLYYTQAEGGRNGGSVPGTWRCMGYANGEKDHGSWNVTVWMRVA